MHSYKWSAIERFLPLIIQLLSTIVIARYTSPDEFGLVGILSVFIAISQVFVDGGLSSFLIRKNNTTESDLSTVFFFSVGSGALCYFVLFCLSDDIALYFQNSNLKNILIYVSASIVFSSFVVVHRAILTIKNDFKTQTKASLISAVIASTTAILLAMKGLGVWAIATQSVLINLLNMIFLIVFVKWYPKERFSLAIFKTMFIYSYKVMLVSLIDNIYKNIYTTIIGKVYSPYSAGIFIQSQRLTDLPASNMAIMLQRVNFTYLSKIKENNTELDKQFNLSLNNICIPIFFIFGALSSSSNEIVLLFLGESWIDVGYMISILALSYMINPVKVVINNYILVKGDSGRLLSIEILIKAITTLFLLLSLNYDINIVVYGIFISSILGVVITVSCVQSKYNSIEVKSIFIIIKQYLVACFSSYLISLLREVYFVGNNMIDLMFAVFGFSIVYVFLSIVFNFGVFSSACMSLLNNEKLS